MTYKPRQFWTLHGGAAFVKQHGDAIDLNRPDVSRLAGIIRHHQWKTLLDVGCGVGRFFPLWRSLGLHASGADFSPTQIAVARRKGHPDISVSLASADRLPFEDGSFDVAATVKVLLHVPPPRILSTLKELARVARELVGWEFMDPTVPLAGHNFSHRYPLLLQQAGLSLIEEHRDKNGNFVFVAVGP